MRGTRRAPGDQQTAARRDAGHRVAEHRHHPSSAGRVVEHRDLTVSGGEDGSVGPDREGGDRLAGVAEWARQAGAFEIEQDRLSGLGDRGRDGSTFGSTASPVTRPPTNCAAPATRRPAMSYRDDRTASRRQQLASSVRTAASSTPPIEPSGPTGGGGEAAEVGEVPRVQIDDVHVSRSVPDGQRSTVGRYGRRGRFADGIPGDGRPRCVPAGMRRHRAPSARRPRRSARTATRRDRTRRRRPQRAPTSTTPRSPVERENARSKPSRPALTRLPSRRKATPAPNPRGRRTERRRRCPGCPARDLAVGAAGRQLAVGGEGERVIGPLSSATVSTGSASGSRHTDTLPSAPPVASASARLGSPSLPTGCRRRRGGSRPRHRQRPSCPRSAPRASGLSSRRRASTASSSRRSSPSADSAARVVAGRVAMPRLIGRLSLSGRRRSRRPAAATTSTTARIAAAERSEPATSSLQTRSSVCR